MTAEIAESCLESLYRTIEMTGEHLRQEDIDKLTLLAEWLEAVIARAKEKVIVVSGGSPLV